MHEIQSAAVDQPVADDLTRRSHRFVAQFTVYARA
jgi:hypothetical protein